MQALLQILANLVIACGLSQSIEPHTPHLSPATRFKYAYLMTAAAAETELDPYLIAAVMWHESRFQNLPVNNTNDYGLMQVHWQRSPEPWLRGLTREALLDPRTNIFAGARELAFMRAYCRSKGHSDVDHYWWAHYKWGVLVLDAKYGHTVLGRRNLLARRIRPLT